MKLCTLGLPSGERVGILESDRYLLLDPKLDMVDLAGMNADERNELRAQARDWLPSASATLLPPIRRFGRDVLCTGWNYWDHFEEGIGRRGDQEVERPDAPTFFTKAPNALTGPYDDIPLDTAISEKWDYEGEVAVVIGKQGVSIKAEHALDHVFGYMLANDISQRDLQRRHGGQWLKGKSIDKSSPIGPYLVTADEIAFEDITIETFVNGEKRQSATTRQMAFSLPELIAEISMGMTLFPGDVLLTGTPSGIGMAMTPQRFLHIGDEIRVFANGLGELKNCCQLGRRASQI